MAVIVSLLFILTALVVILLVLGICRASAQADEVIRRISAEQFPDFLDRERS
ncbi:MAG: hypothetical protein KFH87_14960 [Bacteroidetes bacterium]|nr:hypothetical protein [Bacteroidota bacterium]